ncbi:hypothetical protein Syun_001089 [Stephania yunnanensis]|uniref:Uncharacterized protein n=1 Tax=Stephania yunnanensis TaxID=152371 RepID=A0AAP0LIQ7_9MAGN
MIKRRFYKQEHRDGDEVSDSSSSSSSSSDDDNEGSDSEEAHVVEEDQEEVDGLEATGYREEVVGSQCSPSPDSGYESEDSSGNGLDCDPSGLIIDDYEERTDCHIGKLSDSILPGKGDARAGEEREINILDEKKFTQAEFSDFALKSCNSLFKCRICPRIVCLTKDSMMSHLSSKRHTRSEKLFSKGKLKLMLNSDGEIEEEQETHAERHARTVAVSQEPTEKRKKNKGRQRQRLRSKRKKVGNGLDDKGKQSMSKPLKRRRQNDD